MVPRGSEQASGPLPSELHAVLRARDAVARERAWRTFVDTHSRLMLHTARSLGRDYDAVMDRYAYILEQLKRDDCQRLRSYVADGRGKFTTWLTVVARHLSLDHYRTRYGRDRGGAHGEADEQRTARKRLVDLVTDRYNLDRVPDPSGSDPEKSLREAQLAAALEGALNELPARDQLLLAMRFEDDRSAREIAEVMNFPTVFHVYRRVNRAIANLRIALERRGVHDAAP